MRFVLLLGLTVIVSACGADASLVARSHSSPEPSSTWTEPPELECDPGSMISAGHGDFGVPPGGFPEPPERTPEEDLALAREELRRYVESQDGAGYPGMTYEGFVATRQSDESITFTYFEGETPRVHLGITLLGADWVEHSESACQPPAR